MFAGFDRKDDRCGRTSSEILVADIAKFSGLHLPGGENVPTVTAALLIDEAR